MDVIPLNITLPVISSIFCRW